MIHPATLRFLTAGALVFAAAPACSTNPDCSETRTCPGDRAPDTSGLEGQGGTSGSAAITGGRDTGGAPPRATGGRDPRGVGARSGIDNAGGAAAGQAGEGGSTDEPVDPPTGTEPGAACDDDAARLCEGAASDTVLVCTGGTWRAETCDDGSRCDSRDGSCAPIAPGCETLAPGADFCDGNTRTTCGPDLVTAETEVCEGRCVAGACVSATCGDAVVQEGEDCDDGNDVDTDACPSTCHAAHCGDGFVLTGSELCDDGNAVDTDACPTNCRPADCGDGFVHEGEEECDDGNFVNTDDCLTTCEAARCGDGIVNADEECDDSNDDDTDDCPSTCREAACGDGFRWADEEACDDADRESGDGCSSECEAEPIQLALGSTHTCALLGDGRLKCWGDNTSGQVGPGADPIVGDALSDMGPNLPAVLDNVTAVVAGTTHTCAIQRNQIKCWGGNGLGQLGPGTAAASSAQPVTVPVDADPKMLCGGVNATAVLLADNTVRVWGSGAGFDDTALSTVEFSDAPKVLSCGGASVCAVLSNGSVECHGGEVQDGVRGAPVLNLEEEVSPILTVATGYIHACALNADGRVRCWGFMPAGQLGNGSSGLFPGDEEADVPFVPLTRVSYLSSGYAGLCAIEANNKVRCWGGLPGAAGGQPNLTHLESTPLEQLSPIELGPGTPTSVVTSREHTCAIFDRSRVKCWGANDFGQLGIGTTHAVIGDASSEMGDALKYTPLD